MAYRTFRNEATYAAPNIPNPDLTMAAIQGIGRRKDREAAKEQADKRLKQAAMEKFDVAVQEGKFPDDVEELVNRAKDIKSRGVQDILNSGRPSVETLKSMSDAQGLSQKSKLNYQRMQDLTQEASAIASKDPYLKVDVRLGKIKDAVYGEGANTYTREERLKNIQLGGLDEFNAEKQRADWLEKLKIESRAKRSDSETQSGVHTGSESSIEGNMLRYDPAKKQWVGGVSDKHIENYLGSDKRVGQLYDARVEAEIASEWQKMKAAGKGAEVMLALKAQNGGKEPTDQEAIDYLKVNEKANVYAPNATFGARRANAIRADLESAVVTKEKLSNTHHIEQDRSKDGAGSGSGDSDKPSLVYSASTTMTTTVGTGGPEAGNMAVYVPGKVTIVDKNGVKPIQIIGSVPHYDYNTKQKFDSKSDEALRNMRLTVADASFVVKDNGRGVQVSGKDRAQLLRNIENHPSPEDLLTDWYIKAFAKLETGESEDLDAKEKTVGLYYGDVRDKFRAQGIEINEDDPNFKDQTGGIQEIKQAINSRQYVGSNGKVFTLGQLRENNYSTAQIKKYISEGKLKVKK